MRHRRVRPGCEVRSCARAVTIVPRVVNLAVNGDRIEMSLRPALRLGLTWRLDWVDARMMAVTLAFFEGVQRPAAELMLTEVDVAPAASVLPGQTRNTATTPAADAVATASRPDFGFALVRRPRVLMSTR